MPGSVATAVIVASVGAQLDQFRQPEVEHLRAAVARDHDVGGLDVAMDDAARVRRRERAGDLDGIVERRGNRQRPLRQQPIERRAVHQLHRDEGRPRVLADLVDGDDVRMVQRRGGLRLADEAAMPLGVRRRFRRQHLDRNRTPEPRIDGAVNDTHPAAADFSLDPVVRNGLHLAGIIASRIIYHSG